MMTVAMCVKLVMEQQLRAAPLCLSQVGNADSSIVYLVLVNMDVRV